MSAARPLLERAAGAGARLLRVERASAPGGHRSTALRLIFDLGAVELRGGAAELEGEVPEPEIAALPDASEDEPWWSVIGHPLTRVEELPAERGLRLQFRPDGERPKRIALLATPGGVDWRVEAPH